MNIELPDSRKLVGMLIVIIALLLLALMATIAAAWFSAPISIFETIGGYIAGAGVAHQTAQVLADRSPNYASNIVAATVRPPETVQMPAPVPSPSPKPDYPNNPSTQE